VFTRYTEPVEATMMFEEFREQAASTIGDLVIPIPGIKCE
jgi:hypothetical protein